MAKQHEKDNPSTNINEPSDKGPMRKIDTGHEEPSWKDVTKKGPHAYEGPIKEQI